MFETWDSELMISKELNRNGKVDKYDEPKRKGEVPDYGAEAVDADEADETGEM